MRARSKDWPSGASRRGLRQRRRRPAPCSDPGSLQALSADLAAGGGTAAAAGRLRRRPRPNGTRSCGKMRQEQAIALYDLARAAVRKHQPSLAYQLVLGRDPREPGSRRGPAGLRLPEVPRPVAHGLRGEEARDGHRLGRQVRLARQEATCRPLPAGRAVLGGRWVSAEDDARLHRDIASAGRWRPSITTSAPNHSLEAAVDLGESSRTSTASGSRSSSAIYATEADVDALFSGGAGPAAEPPRFNVVYFRDRDEYNRALQAAMPNIGISLGFYLAKQPHAPISSPAARTPTACSTTKPPTSSSSSRGRAPPTWASGPTSGSSKASPCTWSRSARRTASTCWAGLDDVRVHHRPLPPPQTAVLRALRRAHRHAACNDVQSHPQDRQALQPDGRA